MATFMFVSQFSESKMRKTEDVNSLPRRFLDEFTDGVVGIGGVADGVGGAKEHLEADVRDGFPEAAEAMPRILEKEAHGDVEGRAAPHFKAVESGEAMGDEVRGGH
jgi:hypothetical protein